MFFGLGIVVALVILLTFIMTRTTEAFADVAELPDPHKMIQGLRALLDRFDKPDVLNHAIQIYNKDPGELARMELNRKDRSQ
jgi:hypothetical protein